MGSDTRSGAPLTAAGLRLGRPTLADLPEIIALEGDCYADPWPASAFATLPDNPHVHFIAALHPETSRVTGYVVAWFVADEGELANLAVAPSFRGRGIGKLLLETVLAEGRRRGTGALYLEVRESNSAARRLYERANFVEVGRRKSYYRSPTEDALILRRTLKP